MAAHPINLARMSHEELMLLRSSLRAEMRKRGIADSVGIVGEQFAIEHFRKTPGLPKLQLAPRGTKNVDALSRNGDRFSIKTVCQGTKTRDDLFQNPRTETNNCLSIFLL